MLTSDLVRARVQGRTLLPSFVDAERADLRRAADQLVEAAGRAHDEAWTLAELTEALDAVAGTHRSHKVLRGMAKLVLDRVEHDVEAPIPPAEVRAAVFAAARRMGPLALAPDPLDRPVADDVWRAVGDELGVEADALKAALYADLKEAQVIRAWRPLTGEALVHRYNTSLVQALLLKADEVRVTLHDPSVGRVRQLLRYAKFHQLLHRAERDGSTLRLTLDGPGSMFRQSTRYGLQLALFFPALLLQDGGWELDADVLWTRARHVKALHVDHTQGLVSHYADTGAWMPRERTWFLERWAAQDDPAWTLSEDTLPIELGGHGVVLPDFTFTDGKRTAHLEIVGYWRREWLERRLVGLTRHGPGNLVLAVSRKLAAAKEDALDAVPGEVIPFSQVIPVKAVLEALERVAR